ncbi:hypothetical protein AIOL_001016 [Candidatus Rhodobacter oscarellae]|uniref:Hedgehog/Intein (Hint) domain-containing protein n=1 Tax=Candidatus Rhodobacter oscarellae TaxID=1675527 RepID=A0A0J9E2Q7_9RHOB|nr:hypothetical protein AIOL_001016 [Candidatus Rhodobacter lobularis]
MWLLDTNVVDVDGDGNADQGVDGWQTVEMPYTGYVVNIGGTDYPVFLSGTIYSIPYNTAFEDIGASFPLGPGSTSATNPEVPIPYCFLTGTQIATPSGERSVEALQVGDQILTANGDTAAIKWVGRRSVAGPMTWAHGDQLAPVCIAAGALGNHSDLYVSADHGMIVDGLVINASALVNGDTVRFVPVSEMPQEFTYYHIETENHDVILANGAPSETFIDVAGRAAFDNYQEYLDLYGAERIIPEMRMPRISTARLLPQAIKDRLAISQRDHLAIAV